MNTELSEAAVEFGDTVRRALEAAGGDTLVQRCERLPHEREAAIVPLLAELGLWDLDVRSSADELEAAAVACRAAGHWAVPYPVHARLARPLDHESDGLFVVDRRRVAAPLQGLGGTWTVVDLDGRRSTVVAEGGGGIGGGVGGGGDPRYTGFVLELTATPLDQHGSADLALALTLPCWTLLGMLDRALLVTREYVMARRQFGQTLSSFQSVQFQLTDAELERVGLEELAKYALWSIATGRSDAVADALALRLAALEAGERVMRVCHQLHGAIGFCDETVVSWLSRHSQPLRRLPFGLSHTRQALVDAIGAHGLSGLFDELAP